MKRNRNSFGDRVRKAQAAGKELPNLPSKGGGVSIAIDAKTNERSWIKARAEIQAFEQAIHAIGDPESSVGATHMRGVYKLMRNMYGRSKACIPPLAEPLRQSVAMMNAANFSANGLPSGGWAPLSAAYGAWKALRYPGKPTMVADGTLFTSLTTGLAVDKVKNDSIEFASKVNYAKWHQYGTTRMPMRRLVYESEAASNAWASLIGKFVKGNVVGEVGGLR